VTSAYELYICYLDVDLVLLWLATFQLLLLGVHHIKIYASWVQIDVNQFGLYL